MNKPEIELFIEYSKHNTGIRAYETYALYVFVNGKPTWTTYISPECYKVLDKAGIQKR